MIVPDNESCTRVIVLNKVDFPIPFLPNNATKLPPDSEIVISEATICCFLGEEYPIDNCSVFKTICLSFCMILRMVYRLIIF